VAVPLTRPSHATILTGLDPFAHGLRDNVSPPLDAKIPTLATILKGAGFETAGFVSAIVLTVGRDDDVSPWMPSSPGK
jgi:arylsulfatase